MSSIHTKNSLIHRSHFPMKKKQHHEDIWQTKNKSSISVFACEPNSFVFCICVVVFSALKLLFQMLHKVISGNCCTLFRSGGVCECTTYTLYTYAHDTRSHEHASHTSLQDTTAYRAQAPHVASSQCLYFVAHLLASLLLPRQPRVLAE